MASQSTALVGVWRLIPFSEVFAYTKGSNCPLNDELVLLKRWPRPLLYTADPMLFNQGIGGSSKSRDTIVTASLKLVSGGGETDRRYRVMIMQSRKRVWVRIT